MKRVYVSEFNNRRPYVKYRQETQSKKGVEKYKCVGGNW